MRYASDYKKLLQQWNCDCFMLESQDKEVTMDSAVCLSPFDKSTNLWISGMNMITSMTMVIRYHLPIVTKGDHKELDIFLDKYYKKEIRK
jgi:hypothetical protein